MGRDKIVMVTGGSHGIGKAVVRRFLDEGNKVAFCARNEEDLLAATDEFASIGPEVFPFVADVTNSKQIEYFVSSVLKRFSRIDVLVNNAGMYGPIGHAWEVDPVHWQKTFEANMMSAFLMCQAVIPSMIQAGRGKIINMAGGGAASPFPRYTAYAVSKAALVRYTETLALELSNHNIQVNAVAPGFVATRIHQDTLDAEELAGSEFYQKTKEQLNQGGIDPEIPAELVSFLASDQANEITGKFISSVWDDWKDFEKHLNDINKTDIFTLRRIVPSDRGLDWK